MGACQSVVPDAFSGGVVVSDADVGLVPAGSSGVISTGVADGVGVVLDESQDTQRGDEAEMDSQQDGEPTIEHQDEVIAVEERLAGTCWYIDPAKHWLDETNAVLAMSNDDVVVIGNTHVAVSEYAVQKDAVITLLNRSGDLLWQEQLGWTDHDDLTAAVVRDDTRFLAVGNTRSSGSGGSDAWIIEMDVSGELIWEEDYGGVNNDVARSIARDLEGGYIVVGNTGNVVDGVATSPWIFRISEMGLMQWGKILGLKQGGVLSDVIRISENEFVAVGSTVMDSDGEIKTILVRFAQNGGVIWQVLHSAIPYQVGQSVVQTASGDFVITGYADIGEQYLHDGFVLRVTAEGGFVWQKTLGGDYYDTFTAAAWTLGDHVLLAGLTRSYGYGGADMWLVKMKAGGQVLWEQAHGTPDFEKANAVLPLEDGMILAGRGGVYRLNTHGQLCP